MVLPLKYTRSRHLSTFRPFIMFAGTKIEKRGEDGRHEEKRIKTKKAMQAGSQEERGPAAQLRGCFLSLSMAIHSAGADWREAA